MTKKDHELIAKVLSRLDQYERRAVAGLFIPALSQDNKNFNLNKFLSAIEKFAREPAQ